MRTFITIFNSTLKELIYERVFYIFAAFCGIAIGLSLIFGQMTFTNEKKLTHYFLSSCLTLSLLLSSGLLSLSLWQRESLTGSWFMPLAKPIYRSTYFVAKFLGQCFIQGCLALLMGVWIFVFCLESYTSTLSLAQATFLIWMESCILTAVTYLFSVYTGPILTLLATLFVYLIGHAQDLLQTYLSPSKVTLWKTLGYIVPNLEVFNMQLHAVHGLEMPFATFLWALLYGSSCVLFCLLMGALSFEHRDLRS